MNFKISEKEFEKLLIRSLGHYSSLSLDLASENEIYRALSRLSRNMLSERRKQFMAQTYGKNAKQVYYLSMEFLMGRSLKNSLFNLGIKEVVEKVLEKHSVSLAGLYEQEPDAGLGNGGLGRLAACYLDGMATTSVPGMGYCILYEYGIFKQKIVDGWQQELADNWLPGGDIWIKKHPGDTIDIHFDGEIEETWEGGFHHVTHKNYNLVKAVPADMYVSGYDSNGVSQLRLWEAKAPSFDMGAFNAGEYSSALSQNANVELISKVLYPNDNHLEGKILRLRQQYFLSAASVGDIVRRHLAQYGSLDNLGDKVAVHINDTHPTLAIPELMRIMLDDCGYTWESAFKICKKTFAYTNHTVMSEALEKWNVDIFRRTLPRIFSIIQEMDSRARGDFAEKFPGDQGKIEYMALVEGGEIRMANICCYTCHSINGVSALHSDIITKSVFHDYYLFSPKKFTNVTNGIAYRRWLLQSNPRLTGLLEATIGKGFKKDASELSKFAKYANDKTVLQKLEQVKHQNKEDFAAYVKKTTGRAIDPLSIFDVQVKRMHEYKRQHLNAMNILAQYLFIKENPGVSFYPKTYIFAAKAAPGYYFAKQMMRFIWKIGDLLEADPQVRDILRVIYLEDYNVTTSERLMPASEVSEQISLAGTEASGTGNMKFMLNGALTLGTLDGANIEISQHAGSDNFIQFGMLTQQVDDLRKLGYSPSSFIQSDEVASRVIAFMEKGFAGENYHEIVQNLRSKDYYMVAPDFADYRRAQADVSKIYADRERWNRMSLYNIAYSGFFSADRAVLEYAKDIWKVDQVK